MEKTTKTPEGYIDSWRDRKIRMWTTLRKDAEGNQIGEAEYSGTKEGMERDHWSMAAEAGYRRKV